MSNIFMALRTANSPTMKKCYRSTGMMTERAVAQACGLIPMNGILVLRFLTRRGISWGMRFLRSEQPRKFRTSRNSGCSEFLKS